MFESFKGGLLPGSATRTSLHAQGNTALATYCLDAPSDEELTTSKGRRFSQRDKTKYLSFLKTNASCQAEQGKSLSVLVKNKGSGHRLDKSQLHFSSAVCCWTSARCLWTCFGISFFFNGCNNCTFFTRLLNLLKYEAQFLPLDRCLINVRDYHLSL